MSYNLYSYLRHTGWFYNPLNFHWRQQQWKSCDSHLFLTKTCRQWEEECIWQYQHYHWRPVLRCLPTLERCCRTLCRSSLDRRQPWVFHCLKKTQGNINKRDSFRSCDHGEKHGAKLYLFTFVASFLLKYSCSKNFVILSSYTLATLRFQFVLSFAQGIFCLDLQFSFLYRNNAEKF